MSATSSQVSACVANFNGERYLARCLSALQTAHGVGEIIVVDDASTDGSVQLVSDSFPSARISRRDRNGGPAATRNTGLREARNDLILFVDNDVYVPPDIVRSLGTALRDRELALLAVPRLVRCVAPDLVQFDGADSHFLGAQTLLHVDRPLASAPTEIRVSDTSLVTACFLLDRRRGGSTEIFDESFFMFFEDHDFGYRCRALGFTVVGVPTVQCMHDSGTIGISLRESGVYSDLRVRGVIKNRWQLMLKNYQLRTLLVLGPLCALYELAQLGIAIRKGWLRHWGAAVLWMLRCLPGAWKERRRIQRLRTVADRDILRDGPLPFTTRLATTGAQRLGQRVLEVIARGYWRFARHLI